MRRLIGVRPSPAMVVALLALFVGLGGTAIAAFVVSDNSQIAPNTIYGGGAPAGKNDNVVANSLNGTDILEAGLATVPDAARLGGKLPSAYLPNSVVLRYGPVHFTSDNGTNTQHTLLTIGVFTLTAACTEVAPAAPNVPGWFMVARTSLRIASPAQAMAVDAFGSGRSFGSTNWTVANGPIPVGEVQVGPDVAQMRDGVGSAFAGAGRQISFHIYQGTNLLGHVAGTPQTCDFGGAVEVR